MKISFKKITRDHSGRGRRAEWSEDQVIYEYDPYKNQGLRLRWSPAKWTGSGLRGRIDSLPYVPSFGPFAIHLESSPDELKDWLESYIEWKPEEALDLLVKMLPLAVEKLKEKHHEIQGRKQ